MSDADHTGADKRFLQNAMGSFIQIGAVLLLILFCYQIIAPFVGVVLWGLIIAVALYPLHQAFAARLGDRQKLSATLIVLIGLAILLVPVSIMTDSSIESAKSLSSDLRAGTLSVPPPSDKVAGWPLIGERAHEIWSGAAENLQGTIEQFKPQLASVGEWLIRAVGSGAVGILQFVASLIIAGVFLVSGESGYRACCTFASAIAGNSGKELTDLSIATIRSVAKGVLGVAIIQTLLSAIGLFAIGVPGAGIWTAIILVLAVMQVPTLLIMGPIAVWVFSMSDPVPATIFAIYAVLVSLSDNFLKPMLLGRGVEIPMLVILLGAIGGAIYAGVIGLFVGSVVLAVGYTLLMAWMKSEMTADTSAGSATDS